MSRELYNYKRACIKASKELLYPETVTNSLRKANSETEIYRIMRLARQNKEV